MIFIIGKKYNYSSYIFTLLRLKFILINNLTEIFNYKINNIILLKEDSKINKIFLDDIIKIYNLQENCILGYDNLNITKNKNIKFIPLNFNSKDIENINAFFLKKNDILSFKNISNFEFNDIIKLKINLISSSSYFSKDYTDNNLMKLYKNNVMSYKYNLFTFTLTNYFENKNNLNDFLNYTFQQNITCFILNFENQEYLINQLNIIKKSKFNSYFNYLIILKYKYYNLDINKILDNLNFIKKNIIICNSDTKLLLNQIQILQKNYITICIINNIYTNIDFINYKDNIQYKKIGLNYAVVKYNIQHFNLNNLNYNLKCSEFLQDFNKKNIIE